MLRPGIDAQGHRKSSRERGRSDSSISAKTQTTDATSVSEQVGLEKSERAKMEGSATDRAKGEDASAAGNTAGLDELTTSMSALKMVPRTITFGQRKGRSGLAKK